MVDLIKAYRTDPQIRALALSLIADLPAKAWRAEIEAVFDFVCREIRYTMDTYDVETIQTPIALLATGQGDCDDMAVLAASLLQSIGHPVRLIVTGYEDMDQYQHVYVEALNGRRWTPLECTVAQAPLGWSMPGAVARMVFNV